jgi:flagellar motor switch protein FliN/FliY
MSEEISESNVTENNDGMAATMAAQEEGAKSESDGDYERAEFKDLNTGSSQLTTADANLDVILDIPVTLSMEIGRTEIPIQNLLQLNQGSVVELDRLAGEPMDVLINGTLIAHGEVVVINEKFGIRLTDVISPAERVKKLK